MGRGTVGRLERNAGLILCLLGCAKAKEPALDAEAIALNNRGVGLMGKYDYEAARETFASLADRHPEWLEARVNLAIAILNRREEGDEARALELLAEVLEKDSHHLRAHYCTGILLLHGGSAEKAFPHFERVAKADPADAYPAYFAGQTLFSRGKYDESIGWYREAMKRDPNLRSAYYGASQCLQRLGQNEEARRMLEQFQALASHPQARLAEFKYTRMGPWAEAATVDLEPRRQLRLPQGAPFSHEPVRLAQGIIGASLSAADFDGDSRIDLFVPGAVLLNKGEGFVRDTSHPLAAVKDVNAALWGDYDNDGLTDVYLCRRGPNQLWRRTAAGPWKDVTAETKTAAGRFDTVDGALFDADHDGDLDLFLVNADGPNELLNNNRDGKFRPLGQESGLAGDGRPSRGVVVTDLEGDRDADLIVLHSEPPQEVYLNERAWKYRRAYGFEDFVAARISAVVAGDSDADGRVEIYASQEEGIVRWARDEAGQWMSTLISARPRAAQMALADVNGDGRLELVVSAGKAWEVVTLDGQILFSASGPPLLGWLPVVLSPASGPEVMGLSEQGRLLLWRPGPGRLPFAALSFTGRHAEGQPMRSNASGIGTQVALRVDSRWTALATFRGHSGPGQSLEPLAVGLGGESRIDFAAIDWSDGVFQTEIDLEAGKLHRIAETDRQLSSCPVLFAFDGLRYRFVTDLLGVGGIGFALAPEHYGEPDPTENILLPEGFLQARRRRYELKIAEPMEEVVYLDAVRLVAYDLPPGWEMTLDERKGVSAPFPSGEPRFFRKELSPVRASNDRGQDVAGLLMAADFKAAPPGEPDPRFLGRTTEHAITLTFRESLDSAGGEPLLVADGWIEYPYSQTMFASWQARAPYRAPTLEARGADGQWHTVWREFGYPAGMPRQMSMPLRGLPPGTRELRISTNMEIYWDRLRVALAEPCPGVKRQELSLRSARLAPSGFPLRTTGPQRRPDYDYERRSPLWDTRHPAGYYTAIGEVEELAAQADGAVAIFGPGEEVHLEFAAIPSEPAPGWKRRFVLEAVGWCKDMDLYTKDSDTLEPLPVPAQASPHRVRLNRLYNTRFESGR